MDLSVGLAQIYPKLGNVTSNLKKHLDFIEQAREERVQLIVFPELSLTGYYVMDMVAELAIKAEASDPVYGRLLEASQKIDIMFGFVQEDARNRFFISAAYLSKGETVHIHQKVYLPTYGMFQDGRFFDQGTTIRAFDTQYGRMGMLICEDFWHMSAPYLLWMDGADILLLHSCSPSRGVAKSEGGRLTSTRWLELMNQSYATTLTNYVIHVNRVGYEDGKNFWGGSSIASPDGEFIEHGEYFDEKLIVKRIDLNQLHRTRSRVPLLRDERPLLVQQELNRIMEKEGTRRW